MSEYPGYEAFLQELMVNQGLPSSGADFDVILESLHKNEHWESWLVSTPLISYPMITSMEFDDEGLRKNGVPVPPNVDYPALCDEFFCAMVNYYDRKARRPT